MKPLSLLLVDDHEVVRRGLLAVLATQPEWNVLGEASNGQEAIDKTAELKPEIVIMDISMPVMNGMDAARRILEMAPETKILLLTMFRSEGLARQMLEMGARGYVLKSEAATQLITAVEALSRNETFVSPGLGNWNSEPPIAPAT